MDENQVTITLSWSDFKDTEEFNTKKDLDLFVYNTHGDLVGSSELIQKGEAPIGGDPKLSSHARESVTLENLDRGSYLIKIKAKSVGFEAQDHFRVLLKSEKPIRFSDESEDGDIFPPADNPNAITVGELEDESSSVGPTQDKRFKPDVFIRNAQVQFTDGTEARGSSTAAAFFASSVVAMKTYRDGLGHGSFGNAELQKMLLGMRSSTLPKDPNLLPSRRELLPSAIQPLVSGSDSVAIHRVRESLVVLTLEDPYQLPAVTKAGITGHFTGDILAVTPEGKWTLFPKSLESRAVKPWIEFRQTTSTSNTPLIWKTPKPE